MTIFGIVLKPSHVTMLCNMFTLMFGKHDWSLKMLPCYKCKMSQKNFIILQFRDYWNPIEKSIQISTNVSSIGLAVYSVK